MNIYRIAREEYAEDISGYGAFLYGGRWNGKGQYALYCTEHISLAVLEIVVNYNRTLTPMRPKYHLIEIQIPENTITEIDHKVLKKDWTQDLDYTQYIGDQFLLSQAALALKVPSAVIPEEHNYLINPQHKDFKKLKIVTNKAYGLDERLF
ncbi:hypothetical protein PIECOFPK_01628 [Mycovorax composti]|jgi:Uncharacterized conserved protein|uniref:RES domain-containing protein n=2 Tax=Chitinophagaceae TaxID=563835 RepID=A0ABZ2EKR3_9BACT